jgi:hypothetical protein
VPTPTRTTRTACAPRGRRSAAAGFLAAITGFALLTLLATPAFAQPDEGTQATVPTPTAGTGHPVVLVGVTGLRWDDVGPLTTPALWRLSQQGAVGTTVVRSVRTSACPVDGWLAVSTGTRAADLPAADGSCRLPVDPAPGSTVPGWADYVASAAAESFSAHVGLLGDALVAGTATVTGLGPGAAIALADSSGRPVGEHLAVPSDPTALTRLVRSALATSRLVVVDAGSVRDPGSPLRDRASTGSTAGTVATREPTRTAQVQAIDERVRAVLAGIDATSPDATVLVMSLADSGPSPQLQLAVARGPAAQTGTPAYTGALLGSRSTRQPGLIQASDLTPTLLSALGLRADTPAGVLIGTPLTTVPGPTTASARVAALVDANLQVQAVRPLVPGFYLTLLGLNLIVFLLATVGLDARVLERWRGRRLVALTSHPVRALRPLRVLALGVAAIPVSTFLANLTPWWRAAGPSSALAAVVAGWVVVITAVALLPPWRRALLGPLCVVTAATTGVISADIATGARLQLSSLMGPQSVVAGRFYGFNNTAFTLVAVASILLATAVASVLVMHGRRGLAVAAVVTIGVVTTALDGLPSIGADFGGPPALVPGFAVLALLTAGVRLTWRRLLAVLGAAAGTVTAFAVADWLRPPDSRTHLGRFVQTVLDGGAWKVVDRKLQTNAAALGGGWLAVAVLVVLVLVLMVVGRSVRRAVAAPDGGSYGWLSAHTSLARLGADAPVLWPGLLALTVTLVIGFALNDSGILVPGIGAALAVPLLVATYASWLLALQARSQPAPA